MEPFRVWYDNLNKPSWTPSPETIGTIWTILYPIIFLTHGTVLYRAIKGQLSWMIALPFIINLIANAAFSPIQFGLRNNLLATIDLLVILGTIVWGMIVIWPEVRWIAYAMIPYLVWVTIAGVAQVAITVKN